MVAEEHPFVGQSVDVGRLKMGVSGAAHGVPSLVVGENEQDVRPLEICGICREDRSDRSKQEHGGEKARGLVHDWAEY